MTERLRWLGVAVWIGCGGATTPPADESGAGTSVDDGSGGDTMGSDSRVSTSAGVEDGLVVLWPRVVGFPEEEPAALQAALREIASGVLPDAPVDVRPEPERVCPRSGCSCVSVGSLLVQTGDQCLVVVLVSEAGPSPARAIPVLGRMTLRAEEIPFREPAESFVTARDFAPCEELGGALQAHRAEIEAAVREAD